MASGDLGRLSVNLMLEAAQWIAGLTKAEDQLQRFEQKAAGSLNNVGGYVADLVGKFGTLAVASFAFDGMVKGAMAAEESLARLNVAVTNVGEGFGITTQHINETAKALAATTQVSVNDVRNAAAEMMRYGGVTQQVMDRALKASVDYAAFTGTDLSTAMSTLGKAITEPEQGIARLQRQIGYLDDATKEHIKDLMQHGEVVKAQNELLEILESRTKGAAEAMENTASGAVDRFTRSMKGLGKTIADNLQLADGVHNLFAGMAEDINQLAGAIKQGDFAAFGLWLIGFHKELEKPLKPNTAAIGEMKPEDWALIQEQSVKATEKRAGEMSMALIDAISEGAAYQVKTGEEIDAKERQRHQEYLRMLREREQAHKAWMDSVKQDVNLAAQDEINWAKSGHEIEDIQRKQHDAAVKFTLDAIETENKLTDAQAKREELVNKQKLDAWHEQYDVFFGYIQQEYEDMFNDIFGNTKHGWEDMLKNMQKAFQKYLMDYIWKELAKPLMLNLVPGPGGTVDMSALGSQGVGAELGAAIRDGFKGGWDWLSGKDGDGIKANIDEPSMANAIEQALGNTGGGGIDFSKGSGYALGLTGATAIGGIGGGLVARAAGAGPGGVNAAMSMGATGAALGFMIGSIVPVIGNVVGAALGAVLGTVIGYASDPKGNAMRSARFGSTTGAHGLTDWQGTSAFGSFGFSEGKWLSGADMGDQLKAFISGIEKMDNALAKYMSPDAIARVTAKLNAQSQTYNLGMEHGGVTNLAEIAHDRLNVITAEINAGLGKFVEGFQGSTDDLIKIIDAYLAGLDELKQPKVKDILSNMPKSDMEAWQQSADALTTMGDNVTGTAESISALTKSMDDFRAASVQMALAIDAAAESIHKGFMDTKEEIATSVMTPEQKYQYLQDKADALYAQLQTETDPAKIQALSQQLNDTINKAWATLDDTGRKNLAKQYIDRIDQVDALVASKMSTLRQNVVDNADTILTQVGEKLKSVFDKMDAAAAKQDSAADKQVTAANTPVTVVVSTDSSLVGGSH